MTGGHGTSGSGLPVRERIVADSRAEWDEIGDAGRRHAEAFDPGIPRGGDR